MKTYIKIILAALFMMQSLAQLSAQQVNNLYFIDNAPVRHYLNPAFQPLSDFYIGIPGIGYTMFGVGNNSFSISSLHTNKDKVFDNLKSVTTISNQEQLNLLNFGFRNKDVYWSFAITTKVDVYAGLPKDMIQLLMYGNATMINGQPVYDNTTFNFEKFSMGSTAYTEVALGYAKMLNEKWSVGAKLKYLHGLGNVNATFNNFDLTTGIDEWKIKANGTINASTPYDITVGTDLGSIDITEPSGIMEFVKPAGTGAAIDLGATFKPFDFLTVGAAITDLGFIGWRRKANNIALTTDYTFNGAQLNASTIFDDVDVDALVDSILDGLEQSAVTSNTKQAYTTGTYPKLNASAEFGILKNTITFGLLSTTAFQNKTVYQDLTTSINLRPVNWFNMALSYSLLNGKASNIGAGVGLRIGFINAFFTTDYIPLNYTNIPLSAFDMEPLDKPIPPITNKAGDIAKLPYKTDRFNFALGFSFVVGNSRDKDKDGVNDRRDKCPETPFGVVVNKTGCPLDTDGDSVYDYLDKCIDTPIDAYGAIDADGCPLDTDGDGVYDYIDKCAETPMAALGKVDSVGCPKDADLDGVADYFDKCPNTPVGSGVDSVGCSIDTDKDGIADYIDRCANTPKEAFGLVDAAGCPSDNDQDGVPDYLDKCLNTVIEARAMVDSVGCPLDTDNDGVYDYLDKCPDTPKGAFGLVDSVGCPIDSDGDSVYDYMDKCPKIAGVASALGCPELNKEVRMLFQKALQGIQFEAGKATIKPVSFTILNQVTRVLVDNSSLIVEVQGHTDNVGEAEMNKTLSENRANAVRKYIIAKGVDEKRITANGYGDTKPVVPNTTSGNKAKNRRVEFVVSFD